MMIDWLTNNGTYHNMKMCMNGDTFWIVARMGSDLFISITYFMFACMNWNQFVKSDKNIMALGFMALAVVFFFCGISGYLLDFFSYWIPTYKLSTITKIIDGFFMFALLYLSVSTPFLRRLYGT